MLMNNPENNISDLEKRMMITELIGLGEGQREIYDRLEKAEEINHKSLKEAYKLHEQELRLLIKYQNETNI